MKDEPFTESILIVIDMQNDFVSGALGSDEAKGIVSAVCERIKLAHERGEPVIFTRDMHFEDYSETLEGKYIPVPHCVFMTSGFEIYPEIEEMRRFSDTVVNKKTFGTMQLADEIKKRDISPDTVIELCGLCTDICVIANAVLLRTAFPELKLCVNSKLCAGSTPEKHSEALDIMKSLCIDII